MAPPESPPPSPPPLPFSGRFPPIKECSSLTAGSSSDCPRGCCCCCCCPWAGAAWRRSARNCCSWAWRSWTSFSGGSSWTVGLGGVADVVDVDVVGTGWGEAVKLVGWGVVSSWWSIRVSIPRSCVYILVFLYLRTYRLVH